MRDILQAQVLETHGKWTIERDVANVQPVKQLDERRIRYLKAETEKAYRRLHALQTALGVLAREWEARVALQERVAAAGAEMGSGFEIGVGATHALCASELRMLIEKAEK